MARKRRLRKTRRIREARAKLEQAESIIGTSIIDDLSAYIEQNFEWKASDENLSADEPVAPNNPIKSQKKKTKAKKVSKKRVTKKRTTKKKVLASED